MLTTPRAQFGRSCFGFPDFCTEKPFSKPGLKATNLALDLAFGGCLEKYPDTPKSLDSEILFPLWQGEHHGILNDGSCFSFLRIWASAQGTDNWPIPQVLCVLCSQLSGLEKIETQNQNSEHFR